MTRLLLAALIAGGLMATPLTPFAHRAAAQAQTDDTQAKPKTTKKAKSKKPLSPAQQALRERQKKCGAEWKAAKAAGTLEKGMKWPKFWSACNKRLKASS